MSQVLSLYRLQQIDSRVDRAQARLQAIQKLLEDDIAINQVNEKAQTTKRDCQTSEQALLKAENAVQDQRIKIEQTESNLYSGTVHNPKELQDLQDNVAALKRHLISLEDHLLETMLALEEAESLNKIAQATLLEVQTIRLEQNQGLKQEQETLIKEKQNLLAERNATAESISNEHILLYNQLREQRRGVAVASLSENACAACGSTLTPAQVQNVRAPGKMERCPSCGRILYGS